MRNQIRQALSSLATMMALATAVPAHAERLVVSTTFDEADGSCGDGDCSLRDAVASAVAEDTIYIPAGTYLLTLGQIVIDKHLFIEGAGPRSTIIDGNRASRLFQVTGDTGLMVFLHMLTLTHGQVPVNEGGGAILVSQGSLFVALCTFSSNTAGYGGGIAGAWETNITVQHSTFYGNSSSREDFGGGAIAFSGGLLDLEFSTLSGNSALAGGGAIFGSYGSIYAEANTIAGNSPGGGIMTERTGHFFVENILDLNSPYNCRLVSRRDADSADNLSGDTSCPFRGSGDLVGVASQIRPLNNNGGPTDTRSLPPRSPAVDSVTLRWGCNSTSDQRLIRRPQGLRCDRGAFELAPGATTSCATEEFGTNLGALTFNLVGDADQGQAVASQGAVQLSSNGSSFYHGSDNGGFLHRSVTGDFRVEVELKAFPVNAGGSYRRSGITVRTGIGSKNPRVYIEYLPMHPIYGQSALMFDYRGLDGVAKELASTRLGLDLPLWLAIDRRGDQFSVGFSSDGINWVKPAGAAGGSTTIAMPATIEAGLMQASYDSATAMTSELDHFQVCQPILSPLPALPSRVACTPGQPVDVIFLLKTSGSSTAAFPGFPSKLDAARQVMTELSDLLQANLPGSRIALISYNGGPAPEYVTGPGATLVKSLTSDFAAVVAAAGAINVQTINPTASSSFSQALEKARQVLETESRSGSRPVIVVIGDGFVNVDSEGNGPATYRTSEMQAISILSGSSYRRIGDVAWLGGWNSGVFTWDGEALANVMAQALLVKSQIPQVAIHTAGLNSDSYFRPDLLRFIADYGSGIFREIGDPAALDLAVDAIFDSLSCR